MVHRWSRLLALLAALGLVATGCGAEREGPPAEYTLVLADSFPSTHPVSREGARYFVKRAGELSGGRIRFEYYPSEQLGAPQDFPALVRSGLVDVAMVSPGYASAQLPLSGVADLPGMSPDACRGALAVEPLLAEDGILTRADFAPDGLRPLLVGVVPGYEVFTGGGREVRSPSDVEGLQLRSAGGTIDRTVFALGSTPVAMPVTELYEAVSRGTVDGTVLGPLSALPYRLDEAATNVTDGAQLGSFTISYAIAEPRWAALPPDLRDALTRAGRDTTRHLCRELDERTAAARVALAEGGIRFHRLSPDEQRIWQAALAPVRGQWVADMEALGLPGRARRWTTWNAASARSRGVARVKRVRARPDPGRGRAGRGRRARAGRAGRADGARCPAALCVRDTGVLVARLHHRLPYDGDLLPGTAVVRADRMRTCGSTCLPRDAGGRAPGCALVGAVLAPLFVAALAWGGLALTWSAPRAATSRRRAGRSCPGRSGPPP